MTQPTSVAYQERLRAPWWWWLLGLGCATVLAAPLTASAPGVLRGLALAVTLPVTAVGLWWLGRIRVAVHDGELQVDDARLPVRFIAQVVPLDAEGRRQLLGPDADPMAFVVQRPWVSTAVQVVLDDPADPTPYWLVSSAHPARLAAALDESLQRAGHGPGRD